MAFLLRRKTNNQLESKKKPQKEDVLEGSLDLAPKTAGSLELVFLESSFNFSLDDFLVLCQAEKFSNSEVPKVAIAIHLRGGTKLFFHHPEVKIGTPTLRKCFLRSKGTQF